VCLLWQIVSAPSEAWCILQGEGPCRERVSHPPVSSVAPVAEFRDAGRTKQVKRTQRIMQAVGESALPEVLASLRNEPVPVAEGCNVRRRQYKIIRKWQGCEGPAEFSSRGMYEEMYTRTWEAHSIPGLKYGMTILRHKGETRTLNYA